MILSPHKKIVTALIALFLALFPTLPLQAQETGEWYIHPVVGNRYDQVAETQAKVYFLSSGALFSFDKQTNETFHYNTQNALSGNVIKKLWVDHGANRLVVVYADSNMDILCDDGSAFCLPEIRDAVIADDKTINDVAFGGGRMVVATNFGLVIYDSKKLEVVESANYHTPIEAVAVCGDNLLIYYPYELKTAPLGARHSTLESFARLSGMYALEIVGLDSDHIVWKTGQNLLAVSTLYFDRTDLDHNITSFTVDSPISLWQDGFYFRSADKLLTFNNECEQVNEIALTPELQASTLSLLAGPQAVWAGGKQGTACFDLTTSAPTVLSDWYKPQASTCLEITFLTKSADGKRIYVSNLGPTSIRYYLSHKKTDTDGVKVRQCTDMIDEYGEMHDVSALETTALVTNTVNAQNAAGDKAMYGGVTRLAEDPNDPSTYFIGNGLEGIYVIKDRQQVWNFNNSNTPMDSYWGTRVFDVNFDPAGNLWVGYAHKHEQHATYIMLPAVKLKKGYDKITPDDWQFPKLNDMNPLTKDHHSLFCRKSRYAFFANDAGHTGLFVLDTKGTYDVAKDDTPYNFHTLTDQDGNSIDIEYYIAFAEDHLGRVWLGTSQGIYYMTPTAGINENSTVTRPKVPRNDGTNFADYLLDSDQINDIAVDPSNRKWVATDFSGVYLVSENGDKIIKHFHTGNSPLPSNRITAVACSEHDNTVYFGTQAGLISYKSDSSPAKDDYSEIYAYPNPVRPDYFGDVTITGLMDNSLVKIADAAGHVIHQTRSEGGMATWNGCNSSGQRVSSGVYYVFVSSGGENQTSSGAVTKIMVIN